MNLNFSLIQGSNCCTVKMSEILDKYEIFDYNDAIATLQSNYPEQWNDLIKVLTNFKVKRSEILTPGGSLSVIAKNFDKEFVVKDWTKKRFEIPVIHDGQEYIFDTHEVDNYKDGIVCDLEWNNKTEFLYRNLLTYRLLYEHGMIGVGIIVTRCTNLQSLFNQLGKGESYGASTTHMDKLIPIIKVGGSGNCPILAIGISKNQYINDRPIEDNKVAQQFFEFS